MISSSEVQPDMRLLTYKFLSCQLLFVTEIGSIVGCNVKEDLDVLKDTTLKQ